MNTAIVSSIIGTVGAAFIAVLVFFLQALRDDIRAVGARIDKVESGLGARFDKVESGLGARFDKVDTDLGGIDVRLARIETTQEEHGRQLARIADHGERIAALEGAVAATS